MHVQIPCKKLDPDKANPAIGVSVAQFSATGRYLASHNESQNKAVWIWDMQALCLICVLLHEKPVRQIAWDPMDEKLAICTSSRRSSPLFLLFLLMVSNFHSKEETNSLAD
jgi:WD40 repeat protein